MSHDPSRHSARLNPTAAGADSEASELALCIVNGTCPRCGKVTRMHADCSWPVWLSVWSPVLVMRPLVQLLRSCLQCFNSQDYKDKTCLHAASWEAKGKGFCNVIHAKHMLILSIDLVIWSAKD